MTNHNTENTNTGNFVYFSVYCLF